MATSGPPTRGFSARAVAGYRSDPNTLSQALFAPLPDRYDRLAALLSMGQDPRWRAAAVAHVAAARPGTVLDVACGPGAVTTRLARTTDARVVGVDLSAEMLDGARERLGARGLMDRVSLVRGRAESLPFDDGAFDALTVTYLLRYVTDPAATIRELARVVRPGGAVASLEFFVPRGAWLPLWRLYTRAVLPAAGLVAGGRAWWDVGRFLGPNIEEHYRLYPLDWTLEQWRGAGITDVCARAMSLGGGVVITGRRAG